MAVYRFRVTFEEYDEVYRDIEIRSTQTFEQFHTCIQSAIGFDASKPASFYMSNDYWKKGQEITKDEVAKTSGSKLSMNEARMCDFIADPHQKIYYVFDQPSQWTFYIELIKILPDGDQQKKYPAMVKSNGDAPKQYLKVEPPKGVPDPELLDESMFEELLVDEADADADDETSGVDSGFSEEVDEEEYDNIEESSEEDTENE